MHERSICPRFGNRDRSFTTKHGSVRCKIRWSGYIENQIEQAIQLSKSSGLDIEYIVASAETFDFPDKTFDVVTACQCFMYFDKAVALPKIHKVLKENGHFVILFMAWLPFEDKIAKTSEDMVLKYNPAWSGGRMERYELETPKWLGDMFEVANAIAYDIKVPFTR